MRFSTSTGRFSVGPEGGRWVRYAGASVAGEAAWAGLLAHASGSRWRALEEGGAGGGGRISLRRRSIREGKMPRRSNTQRRGYAITATLHREYTMRNTPPPSHRKSPSAFAASIRRPRRGEPRPCPRRSETAPRRPPRTRRRNWRVAASGKFRLRRSERFAYLDLHQRARAAFSKSVGSKKTGRIRCANGSRRCSQ